jgi:hypothetical protein
MANQGCSSNRIHPREVYGATGFRGRKDLYVPLHVCPIGHIGLISPIREQRRTLLGA